MMLWQCRMIMAATGVAGEEGNLFHRTLVGPATERLLALQPGQRVLDAAGLAEAGYRSGGWRKPTC